MTFHMWIELDKRGRADRCTRSLRKGSKRQELVNLARENALMATAWYDMTSRLQQSSVVLQRRSEAPRSWLNRQRMLLDASPVRPTLPTRLRARCTELTRVSQRR